MYLVTAKEMREIDRQTIEGIGIPDVVLMENAGAKVAQMLMERIGKRNQTKIIVLAGHGNNGGDGFVVARHLNNSGFAVETWLIGSLTKCSEESLVNYRALINLGHKVKIWDINMDRELKDSISSADVIIDALLGTGIKGELREPFKNIIQFANRQDAYRVAVDIPTGVNSDTGQVVDIAFKAALTITFALPKLGQLLYPGVEYVGELLIVDISIPPKVVENFKLKKRMITPGMIKEILPIRTEYSHKGTYGHALLIGGSKDMPGAPTLAALAAMRSGAGLTTVVVPASIHSMVFGRVPEAICMGLPEESTGHFSLKSIEQLNLDDKKFTALGVGPGVGTWDRGVEWLKLLIKSTTKPMVIDADGLNLLSLDLSLLGERNGTIVLTPHPGEMARLINKNIKYVEKNRVDVALEFAQEHGVFVVLKGFNTIIATPDGEIYINTTGGPELAKGGTGDVLTGMITGFIAQRIPVKDAVIIAVYLHGLAGGFASYPSNYSTLATEVIDKIGKAIHYTMSNHAD
ncbi:hypothetical protein BHF71_05525 [Vulcanibacillus modesticaldus]|uniref:Bifunctional NAD(P)H-hydrate repair enzyme n=1 Tax=Vulcanibacillus modesticaldus TaxID=337097 RepID=A0A1D2YX50_9BACI|nr:bifunctional ADP-dependent NAD(P)H-hydrate dehydratase/NAD(P)H-hydrate epimerase [Vulcanibacillus modesticaldus]OEG00248.1 hypothetical protein BHF71_05525 [Vulcanibacillus modesticaldus]